MFLSRFLQKWFSEELSGQMLLDYTVNQLGVELLTLDPCPKEPNIFKNL